MLIQSLSPADIEKCKLLTDQLKQVYTYATFHIGLYASMSAALLAIVGFATEDFKRRFRWWFIGVITLFVAAGAFGGLVASNITYTDWDSRCAQEMFKGFTTATVPPFRGWNRYKWFSFLMHYLFWAGVGVGVVGLAVTGVRENRSLRRKVEEALKSYAEKSEAEPNPATHQSSFRSVVKGDCDHRGLAQVVKSVRRIKAEPECAVAEGEASFTSDECPVHGGRVKGNFLALLKKNGDGWSVFSYTFLPPG